MLILIADNKSIRCSNDSGVPWNLLLPRLILMKLRTGKYSMLNTVLSLFSTL